MSLLGLHLIPDEDFNMSTSHSGLFFPIEAKLFIKQTISPNEEWTVMTPLVGDTFFALSEETQKDLLMAFHSKSLIPNSVLRAIEENQETRISEGFLPGEPVSVKIIFNYDFVAYISPTLHKKEA